MNHENTEEEWSSELVQLGGVGSAMGALGMWTGAQHEEDDPLGQYIPPHSRTPSPIPFGAQRSHTPPLRRRGHLAVARGVNG